MLITGRTRDIRRKAVAKYVVLLSDIMKYTKKTPKIENLFLDKLYVPKVYKDYKLTDTIIIFVFGRQPLTFRSRQ